MWRIVFSGGGTGYLVHAIGKDKREAVATAKRKIRAELHGKELRVRSAERIVA